MSAKAVQSQKGAAPEATTMGAFVMHGIGKVGFMEKPVPKDPGAAGAIIKTTSALVCTSDTHTLAGAIGDRKDLTLGHEAVGIVYKLGHDVKGVHEGEIMNRHRPVEVEELTGGKLNLPSTTGENVTPKHGSSVQTGRVRQSGSGARVFAW